MKYGTLLSIALALAGCVAVDQAAVDTTAQRIEPRVVRDCALAGTVKMGNTVAGAVIPVPGAALAATALNAGWDAACADPAEAARIIALQEEAAKGLRDRVRAQAR